MGNQKKCDKVLRWNGQEWPYERIAEKLGISLDTVYWRVRQPDWDVERIITTPGGVRPRGKTVEESQRMTSEAKKRRAWCLEQFNVFPNEIYALSMRWVNNNCLGINNGRSKLQN